MADNYLERKFEEYRSGKTTMSHARKSNTRGLKPDETILKFPSRRVFVTGGANGIGRAIVARFRALNCKVAFCDIDSKNGYLMAQQNGSKFYPVDVADADALDKCMSRVLDEWGDIDILVNNVGVSDFKPLVDTEIADFERVIDINLRSAFVTSRRLAIHRSSNNAENKYGRIINICSSRYIMSEPGSEAYSASKGGMFALTHALMASLSPMYITVNSISPGWICTTDRSKLTEADHQQHPSRRVGTPDDVAQACVYLSLSENDFINGENITIDGGMTKKMIYVE